MTTFFQGQLDYIFFFYGLAFIGLGVVAYILSKEANQRLPWGWLALFGFTHGANEWLDLVALVWGDGVWFGHGGRKKRHLVERNSHAVANRIP